MTVLLLGLAATASADTKAELDNRVRKLMAKFDALQADPAARIPAEKLQKATGVIVMERNKGGLVFGYENGFGIAMIRNDGKWGAFSFMNSHEGSFGAQIGGKSTFVVILLMNEAARDRLLEYKVNFGGEAAGTGGSSSGQVAGDFSYEPPMLVFGQSRGLYGGATIKGGSVASDDQANQNYYGQYCSIKDILFDKKVEPSETAREFARKLEEAAKAK